MTKWIFNVLAILFLVGMVGCATSPSVISPGQSKQALSAVELSKIALYKQQATGLFVDDLAPSSAKNDFFKIDPYSASYEGMRVVDFLGIGDQLDEVEQSQFIKAIFWDIPVAAQTADPIRNIIVPKYFKNGEPLIIHVTKAFTGNKIPTVVLLLNVNPKIRELENSVVRSLGPSVDYPRFYKDGKGLKLEAGDYYSISLLSDGQVSASSAVGKNLPKFEEIKSTEDRVNLTDYYLRDGNRENDALVLPVLTEIIANEKEAALYRAHANLQMFMYYLFSKDLEKAASLSEILKKSEFLKDKEVQDSGIASVIQNDLQKILRVTKALLAINETHSNEQKK